MAQLTITNISTERKYLGDLYTSVEPGSSIEVTRSAADLPQMTALQKAVADGDLTLSVAYSAEEAASGLHLPPSVVEAGDIAPVAGSNPASGLVTIFSSFAAGGGGSADDVEIFPAGALPFKFRVLDFLVYVATAVGASTIEARDEAGGAGNVLASADSATTGRQTNAETVTGVADPGSTKGLFLRRSDSGVAGEAVLIVRPEL
jgi:hypothetical protein